MPFWDVKQILRRNMGLATNTKERKNDFYLGKAPRPFGADTPARRARHRNTGPLALH